MTANDAVLLEAAIQQGSSSAESVVETIGGLRTATEEVLELSARVSNAPSEVIGGLVGAATGFTAGTVAVLAIPAIASAAPVLIVAAGVVGLGLGVLGFRGKGGVESERLLRTESLRIRALADKAEMLRGEIAAAVSAGAPPEVVDGLWSTYAKQFAAAEPGEQPPALPSAKVPLALPPGRPDDQG